MILFSLVIASCVVALLVVAEAGLGNSDVPPVMGRHRAEEKPRRFWRF